MPVFRYGMALKGGQIFKSGTTEEVLTEENLEQIFNIPVKLLRENMVQLRRIYAQREDGTMEEESL
mgnify:CR=1 FL=1